MLDFNVALGRAANPVGGAFDMADDLLREMGRLRIDEALVYHKVAAEADILLGNRLLLELLKGQSRLYPCWIMAPSVLGDLPEPRTWVREAIEAGVRAVRLLPRHSLYTLEEWCVGALFSELERAELPVLLDFGTPHWSERIVPWERVKTLCERYGRLRVVVLGATVGACREAVPLLHRLPNLYLECHALNLPDGFGLLAREGLISHLVFGTGMPARAAECVMQQVLSGGLKGAELRKVCGENARDLLGITDPISVSQIDIRPLPRLGGLVVDTHAHCGSWDRIPTLVKRPDAMVQSMVRCGVHKMVVSSFSAIQGAMQDGNRQTFEVIRQFPDYLYGYCVVNPHYPDEIPGELTRCFKQGPHFIGLKLHCGLHEVQVQDPRYEYALSFAGERELPVLVHGGGKDHWAEVAEKFPHAPIIMAHACAWDGHTAQGRDLYGPVRDVPNLYVDVAGSAAYRGALRALVELVGTEKVLFGSDFPMFDLAFELGRIALSDLTDVQKVQLCGGNALRIFKSLAASPSNAIV